jgi:hypothetical protein
LTRPDDLPIIIQPCAAIHQVLPGKACVPFTGQFLGPLAGRDRLAASQVYYVRVMQQSDTGEESPWSPWHQPFKTEDDGK